MKEFRLQITTGIYPLSIYVGSLDIGKFSDYLVTVLDKKSAKYHIKGIKKSLKHNSAACCSCNYEDGSTVIFFFGIHNFEKRKYEIVTHEVFHSTMMYTEMLGLKYSKDSEEAFTYLNGFINGIILNEFLDDDIQKPISDPVGQTQEVCG